MHFAGFIGAIFMVSSCQTEPCCLAAAAPAMSVLPSVLVRVNSCRCLCRVQLWGAALPLNSPKVPCILDPAARVGVCGDWLTGARAKCHMCRKCHMPRFVLLSESCMLLTIPTVNVQSSTSCDCAHGKLGWVAQARYSRTIRVVCCVCVQVPAYSQLGSVAWRWQTDLQL